MTKREKLVAKRALLIEGMFLGIHSLAGTMKLLNGKHKLEVNK